jgi:glucokinase
VKVLAGIDIGGTKCAVVLGHADGRKGLTVLAKASFPTDSEGGPVKVLQRIVVTVRKSLSSLKDARLDRIGVSCGGPLDSAKGLVLSPPNLPGWDAIPVTRILSDSLGVPAHLQNDANACALAEWRYGAGRGCRNMVFLTFGTGMGGGLILDGRLYSGTNDLAGEVGHIRMAEDGPIGYGKRGSFEGFCSGGGIAQIAKAEVAKRLAAGEEVSFCANRADLDDLTAKHVGEAALRGDLLAREILAMSGRYLGKALAILIDVLNPERIVIGSIFGRCRQFLEPAMEESIHAEALPLAASVCRIVPAGLGESIGDYAALSIAAAAEEGEAA